MSGGEEGMRPPENAVSLLKFFDPPARAEFEAPDVTDFGRQNPDGRLWRHRHAEGVELTDDFVSAARVLATCWRCVATTTSGSTTRKPAPSARE